jgi:hypothetical protein
MAGRVLQELSMSRRVKLILVALAAPSLMARTATHLREHRGSPEHDFSPAGAPPRFAHEIARWIRQCHHEGVRMRKIEPVSPQMGPPSLGLRGRRLPRPA